MHPNNWSIVTHAHVPRLARYARALAVRESKLEAGDARTAATMHNLASVYKELKDYPRALELLNRALGIRSAPLALYQRFRSANAAKGIRILY